MRFNALKNCRLFSKKLPLVFLIRKTKIRSALLRYFSFCETVGLFVKIPVLFEIRAVRTKN